LFKQLLHAHNQSKRQYWVEHFHLTGMFIQF